MGRSVVDDLRTGLLATPLDAVAFGDSVERLVADPQLRQAMGEQSLERVRTQFTAQMSVKKTLRIYESIWSCGSIRGE